MITSLLSTKSRKAWIAGLLSALLTPVLNLLSGSGEITLRALVIAILTGVLTAVAVWATANEDDPAATPVVAVPVVPATAVQAEPVSHLQAEATKDFGGQSVTG